MFSDIDSISGMNLVDVVNVLYFPYLCTFIYIHIYICIWFDDFSWTMFRFAVTRFPENRRNFQGAVVFDRRGPSFAAAEVTGDWVCENSHIQWLFLVPLRGGLPSRELTYPTLEKGKSSSKCHFWGIC